jgi:hypothetical protein
MYMSKIVNMHQEPYDILIDRTTKWGNPFSHREGTKAKYKVSSRREAIQKYSEWVLTQPELMNSLHELKNKTLGCHCKPKACHGDILVKMVLDMNSVDIL